MTRAFLGIGGNVGDVRSSFDAAMSRLEECGVSVVNRGPIVKTSPVGSAARDEFLNSAVEINSTASPTELLAICQQIESELGRVRNVRWGPRTIDIDILLFGDSIVESPNLTIPHPAMWYRRFVLDPLEPIAGNVIHPARRRTIRELRSSLLSRPLTIGLAGGSNEMRQKLAADLSTDGGVLVREYACDQPSSLTIWIGEESSNGFRDLPIESRLATGRDDGSCDEFIADVIAAAIDEPVAV